MKYTRSDSFEKHLAEALPQHPSPIYFIFMLHPFERNFFARCIAAKLGCAATQCTAKEFAQKKSEPSFFPAQEVIICDEPEEVPISEPGALPYIFTGKAPPCFYKKVEKEGVALDLTEEKPWDRTSRLERWLLDWARDKGKVLAREGARYLAKLFTADFGASLQELEKIITYSGEEKSLSLKMVQLLCAGGCEQNSWQIAEGIALGNPLLVDEFSLPSLVGQLRYQLQLGLQIAEQREGIKISPNKREKFERAGLRPAYFIRGLKELFDLELKMRSHISNQRLLLDRFRAKLALER